MWGSVNHTIPGKTVKALHKKNKPKINFPLISLINLYNEWQIHTVISAVLSLKYKDYV